TIAIQKRINVSTDFYLLVRIKTIQQISKKEFSQLKLDRWSVGELWRVVCFAGCSDLLGICIGVISYGKFADDLGMETYCVCSHAVFSQNRRLIVGNVSGCVLVMIFGRFRRCDTELHVVHLDIELIVCFQVGFNVSAISKHYYFCTRGTTSDVQGITSGCGKCMAHPNLDSDVFQVNMFKVELVFEYFNDLATGYSTYCSISVMYWLDVFGRPIIVDIYWIQIIVDTDHCDLRYIGYVPDTDHSGYVPDTDHILEMDIVKVLLEG
nr:hypothetical protein [Tanacetum cinerariifolium]